MIFEDDGVMLGESREELNGRLQTWRQALEARSVWLPLSCCFKFFILFLNFVIADPSEGKILDKIPSTLFGLGVHLLRYITVVDIT
jgi:hypothetical protein